MRSLVQKTNILYLDEKAGKTVTKKYEAFQAPINTLAMTVTIESRYEQTGYQELKKSVLTNLYNPIILMDNTRDNWEESTGHLRPETINPFQPEKKYLVLMGNQRLAMLPNITEISAFLVGHWARFVMSVPKIGRASELAT